MVLKPKYQALLFYEAYGKGIFLLSLMISILFFLKKKRSFAFHFVFQNLLHFHGSPSILSVVTRMHVLAHVCTPLHDFIPCIVSQLPVSETLRMSHLHNKQSHWHKKKKRLKPSASTSVTWRCHHSEVISTLRITSK